MKLKKFIALALTVITLIGVFYFGSISVLKTLYPLKYADSVERQAEENNLSPYFVYAVIECESGFDPEAVVDLLKVYAFLKGPERGLAPVEYEPLFGLNPVTYAP